jgi:uncharacterized protein with GYD domain
MLFLQISRHMPESCPMHNEKAKKTLMALVAKMEKLAKKYHVKMVGSWTAVPQHLIVSVFEAPSMEALLKFSMEPEVMAWMGYNMTETMPVMTLDEVMKVLK